MRNVAALLLALLAPPAMAEQFDLVCTWTTGNLPPVDSTLRVDTDRNTVNGRAATISDAEIRFEGATNNGRTLVTVINRYTGSMDMSFGGPPQPYDSPGRGKCVKPTQRQF